MAFIHYVPKARKGNLASRKGKPYYWWAFRNDSRSCSHKRYFSKTYPRPEQMPQCDTSVRFEVLLERLENLGLSKNENTEELQLMIDSFWTLAEEEQEKVWNPDKDTPDIPKTVCQKRAGICANLASALEDIKDKGTKEDVQKVVLKAQKILY